MQLPIVVLVNKSQESLWLCVHGHEFLDRIVQPPRKQRRLVVTVVLFSVRLHHRKIRIVRDETRVQPTYIQTKPINTHGQFFVLIYKIETQKILRPYSPSCLLSSRRASEGHQNRETKPAHITPTVTAVERWKATLTTDMSTSLEL
jgi:hypothetical protein